MGHPYYYIFSFPVGGTTFLFIFHLAKCNSMLTGSAPEWNCTPTNSFGKTQRPLWPFIFTCVLIFPKPIFLPFFLKRTFKSRCISCQSLESTAKKRGRAIWKIISSLIPFLVLWMGRILVKERRFTFCDFPKPKMMTDHLIAMTNKETYFFWGNGHFYLCSQKFVY